MSNRVQIFRTPPFLRSRSATIANDGSFSAPAVSRPRSNSSRAFSTRRTNSETDIERRLIFEHWDELPDAIRFNIISFLDMPAILELRLVSRAACMFATSDLVWKQLYIDKFGFIPSRLDDSIVSAASDETHEFLGLFQRRLHSPEPGDCVQVLWEGSFNLVSDQTVTAYEGRAWWDAKIVAQDIDRYKIHYPQWDSALWDEWVPRNRIRWAPDSNIEVPIRVGDKVELKCNSTFGRSPWLECVVVDKTADGLYDVGDAIVSGCRYIPRESLRLIAPRSSQSSRRHNFLSSCSIM